MDFSDDSNWNLTGCSTSSPRPRSDSNSNREDADEILNASTLHSSKDNPYKRDSQYTKPAKLVTTKHVIQNSPHAEPQYLPPITAPAPDVNVLLLECESYLNWLSSSAPLSEESVKLQIDTLLRKEIVPSEQFEYENLARYNALEYISNLGALCYYYIELNNFQDAATIIDKTREVVIPCVRNGFLPLELVDSFDYVWVFIRLHASIKEWEATSKMHFFPEIDLTNIPKSFQSLAPKVKAGVLGLKYYFCKWQKCPYDAQVDVLKQAISYDRSYFEWHLCLQLTLRRKRKGFATASSFLRNYSWEEEISEISLANKLHPNHPRCMLATITLLADVAKLTHYKDPNWTVLKFGEIKFQSMLSVKSFIQEQASKVLSLCPKSVEIPSAIAEIFSASLPLIHRNQTLAKDYLEQALKNFPNSLKLNYRLAIYYLTVECNYVKAEELFHLAHSLDEEYYPALISFVQILMRKNQRDVTMEMIDKALDQSHWDSKQRGGLHFFRGLLLCFDSFSKSKAAADEFVKSFQCHEKSLAFHELPSIHRRYGWPQWDTDTKLSFEKIRQKIKRVELAGIEPERKAIFTKILQEIDLASLADSKIQNQTSSRWRR